jgi:hypothetical protein
MFRTAVEVVYGLQDVGYGLGYVAISAGIFTGGIIVWYFVIWLFERLFLRRAPTLVLMQSDPQNKYFAERPGRGCKSSCHLFLQTTFFVGIAFILWIAGAMAGFNPWTTAATSLGISVIITYTLATPLGLIGSGWSLNASNGINVGEHWEFLGMPNWDGRVVDIYNMWVVLERYDEATKSGEEVVIPISQFLSTPRKRNWYKELHFKPIVRDPNLLSLFKAKQSERSVGARFNPNGINMV